MAPMFSDEVSCAHNPQTITFATDHHSATFAWQSAITFFTGKQERIGRYRIFAASDDRITMAIEGETRLTEGGSTVVWILRLVQDGRAYCWGRTDWQPEQCVAVHFRCPDAIPNS